MTSYVLTAFPGVPISRPEIIEMEPHRAKLAWSRVDVPAFGLDEVPLTYMLEVSAAGYQSLLTFIL